MTEPGADGELPADFDEWQCGLTYTVEPRILSPLSDSDRYLINATVRRLVDDRTFNGYAPLYRRASAIAHARLAELSALNGRALQSWIHAQGWFRHNIPNGSLASASLTLGVACDAAPSGEEYPSARALATPATQSLAAAAQRARGGHGMDEIYIDFDLGGAADRRRIVTVSCGEYVCGAESIEFDAYVRRAEGRARFHYDSFEHAGKQPFSIIRREWTVLDIGKQSGRSLAHVNVFYRM